MYDLNKHKKEKNERNDNPSSNDENSKNNSINENNSPKNDTQDYEELSQFLLSKLEKDKNVKLGNNPTKLSKKNILKYFLLFKKFLSSIQPNNEINKKDFDSFLQTLSKKSENENNEPKNETVPMTPITAEKIKNIEESQCKSERTFFKTVDVINNPPISMIKNKSFSEIENENNNSNNKIITNNNKKKTPLQNSKLYVHNNQNDDIFHSRDYSFDLNICKEKNPESIENINNKHQYIIKKNTNKNKSRKFSEERMFEPRSSLNRKKSITFYDDEEENKLTNQSNLNNTTTFEIKVNKSKFISAKEQLIMIKIKELNHETQKFKEERKKVMFLKEEYEQLQAKLLQDIEDFNKKKKNFEVYMLNEKEKLQKDRKDFINESKFLVNLKQKNHSLTVNNKIYQKKIQNLTDKIIELEGYIKKNKIQKFHKNKTKTDISCSNNKSNNPNLNSKLKKDFTDLKKKTNNNNNNNYHIKRQDFDDFELNDLISKKSTIKNRTTKVFDKACSSYYNKTLKNPKPKLNKRESNETNFNINNNTINIYKDCYNNGNTNRNQIRKIKSTSNVRTIYNSNTSSKNIYPNKRYNQNSNLNIFTDINAFELSEKLVSSTNEKNFKKIKVPLFSSSQILEKEQINTYGINTRNFRRYSFRNKNTKNYSINKRAIDIIDSINCVNNINSIINKSINSINHSLFNSIDKYKFKSLSKVANNKMLTSGNIENKNCNSEHNQDIYDFVIPKKYLNPKKYVLTSSIEQINGQVINLYTNNKKEIIFKSGVKKEIYDDGYKLVLFPNGDKKQYFKKEGKIIYYFNESKTVQTTYKNGLNIFKFSNNQIEKHYPNGTKFIKFPDGSTKLIEKENEEKENKKEQKNLIDISSDGDEEICNCGVNEETDKNENENLSDKESLTSDVFFNTEIS